VILLTFVSCTIEQDYYMDGNVKTISATEVTNTSASLCGSFSVHQAGKRAGAEILQMGFVLKKGGSSTVAHSFYIPQNDIRVGEFSTDAKGLLSNTKYQVQASVKISWNGGTTFYGNTIEFTTTNEAVVEYVSLPAAGIMVQTADISSNIINWNSASNVCASSRIGGYSDWRLPMLNELSAIYTNRNMVGGFNTTRTDNNYGYTYFPCYWSSTADGSSTYFLINFSSGATISSSPNAPNGWINGTNSGYDYYARCVRSLP